jgi:hypothetical protein
VVLMMAAVALVVVEVQQKTLKEEKQMLFGLLRFFSLVALFLESF